MGTDSTVKKAYQFAKLSLVGKKRYSGENYEDHSLKLTDILKKYNINDPTTLSVAVLHHSVQDGAASYEDVEKEFGKEIAGMLRTLQEVKIIRISSDSQTLFAENLRKLFLYLAKDLRIVLIKLADILDNMRTLKYVPNPKQEEVAREAIEIFAPLAERLGMGELKGQMQDLAFPYLYPEEYKNTKKLLKSALAKKEKKIKTIKSEVSTSLNEEGIPFRIESRSKHLYSLYKKLSRPEINFDISKIYDLIAFRIVVQNDKDCYRVLGVIHNLWKPFIGRLKDYIASQKPNGYRSIHTTVFGPDGYPFEIQIRTEEMHDEAEFGVAAHWHYDEAKSSGKSGEELNQGIMMDQEKLSWVRALSKWQEEITDNEEFLKSIKTDIFAARILVLTPKGDIKDLPVGATPIDFAYAVHTELGHRAMGAKINNKMISLDYKLNNGDMVEIVVSKNQHKSPSRDWLQFVVTSYAKKKIQKACK